MSTRRDVTRLVVIVFLITLAIITTFSGAIALNSDNSNLHPEKVVAQSAPEQDVDAQSADVQRAQQPPLVLAEASNSSEQVAQESVVSAVDQSSVDLQKVFAPFIIVFVVLFVATLIIWLSRQQGPTVYR